MRRESSTGGAPRGELGEVEARLEKGLSVKRRELLRLLSEGKTSTSEGIPIVGTARTP